MKTTPPIPTSTILFRSGLYKTTAIINIVIIPELKICQASHLYLRLNCGSYLLYSPSQNLRGNHLKTEVSK
mgnify:FL=1